MLEVVDLELDKEGEDDVHLVGYLGGGAGPDELAAEPRLLTKRPKVRSVRIAPVRNISSSVSSCLAAALDMIDPLAAAPVTMSTNSFRRLSGMTGFRPLCLRTLLPTRAAARCREMVVLEVLMSSATLPIEMLSLKRSTR